MINQPITFFAPWGMPLCVMTAITVFSLTGICLIGFFVGPRDSINWILSMTVIPLLILLVGILFVIRKYDLTKETLFIRRLGWSSKINLANLIAAIVDPEAMKKSIRVCGNGGLFCFVVWFSNKKLGSYRAFATDPKRAVVLHFSDRVIVVTPDDPEAFAASIITLKGL